jgi:hypothetical protein
MGRKKASPSIYDFPSLAELERDEGPPPATPADALFTTTQRRMLGFLYGQPDRRFHIRELAELSGSGYGASLRELRRLERAGLICVQERQARRYLQADPNCPIYTELTGLIRKTFGLAAPLREAFSLIAGYVQLAFVFDAFEGEPGPRRPLELLVVTDASIGQGVDYAIEVAQHRLQRRIVALVVKPAELRSPRWFIAQALGQPRTWVVGNESRLAAMTSGP